jgi:hypothetical protein
MWQQNEDVSKAIRALKQCISQLSEESQSSFRAFARIQARNLILSGEVEAANLLRVITDTLDPESG